MSFGEKINFLSFPACLVLVAVPLLLFAAFCLLALSCCLLHNPHQLKSELSLFALFAVDCAVLGIVLIYPVRLLRKTLKRKSETSRYLPSGEELAAFRYRQKHPSAWMRVYTLSWFYLIPIVVTCKTFEAAGLHSFQAWVPASLFWLIAFAITVEMTRPRPERLWAGFLASSSFGTLALLAAVAIIRSGNPKSLAWLLPLLFAFCSGYLAVATFRGFGKRVRSIPGS